MEFFICFTLGSLAAGKLASDVGKIDGANANGGFVEESYKTGIIAGAKMGTEYDSTKIIAGDKSPEGVAKFKHGSERIQQTRKDAIDNTLQKIVEETGMTPEQADTAMLAGEIALGGLGINQLLRNPAGKAFKSWKKSRSSKDSVPNESSNPANNHQNNKSNHAEENKVGQDNSSIKDKNSIPKSNESSKLFPEGGSPKTIEEKVE